MTASDTERDAMLAAISEAWTDSQTPSDLRERLTAFARENSHHVNRLRAVLGSSLAWWIIMGEEAGHDRDILEQVALQSSQIMIAHIALTMKRRQGRPFDPARIAIVAYVAAQSLADQAPPELDLEAICAAAEDIGADTDAENARLRDLIDEIADMDLGDPELEHREIIARCRDEQKKWSEA